MEYTIEQKAVALLTNTLWWRFPGAHDGSEAWTRVGDDCVRPGMDQVNERSAEYHIGDKPPRVLSELERELLEELECVVAHAEHGGNHWICLDKARAAIAKAKGEA